MEADELETGSNWRCGGLVSTPLRNCLALHGQSWRYGQPV